MFDIQQLRTSNKQMLPGGSPVHFYRIRLVELDLQSRSQAGSSDKHFGSFKSTLARQNNGNCFGAPEQALRQDRSKNAEGPVQPAMPWPRHARAELCALWSTNQTSFCWGHRVQAPETSERVVTKINQNIPAVSPQATYDFWQPWETT